MSDSTDRFSQRLPWRERACVARAFGGYLLIGIGGTCALLSAVAFVGLSFDIMTTSLRRIFMLLIPAAFLALGCAIVWLGARIREPRTRRPAIRNAAA
jgi:hypothetical protein